jgi:hypothetical protein
MRWCAITAVALFPVAEAQTYNAFSIWAVGTPQGPLYTACAGNDPCNCPSGSLDWVILNGGESPDTATEMNVVHLCGFTQLDIYQVYPAGGIIDDVYVHDAWPPQLVGNCQNTTGPRQQCQGQGFYFFQRLFCQGSVC